MLVLLCALLVIQRLDAFLVSRMYFACVAAHAACRCRSNTQSTQLREKVTVAEESLKEEVEKGLSLREEIVRRKQHGEMLLARIRFLQVRIIRTHASPAICAEDAGGRSAEACIPFTDGLKECFFGFFYAFGRGNVRCVRA